MLQPTRTTVAAPSLLQVEPSSRCNLRCQMCPVSTKGTLSTQNPGVMTPEVWATVRELGGRIGKVLMTGFGEPFLHPGFLDMLRELDAAEVSISFSTNGILVTDEIVRELNQLKHLAHVNVSIDSPDEDVYREVRRGDVHRALEGMKRLVHGLHDGGSRITVSSVLMASTAESLLRFPAILNEIGLRKWIIQNMADWNLDLLTWHLHRGGLPKDYLQHLRRLAAEHQVDVTFENPERIELEANQPELAVRKFHTKSETETGASRVCNSPWDAPFIDKDGRILPCCYADPTAVMGDLREESFDDIWNGQRYQQFRADLVQGGRSLPQICANCTIAPVGLHPRGQFAVELCLEDSVLSGAGPFRLVVRNVGVNSWDQSSGLRVATAEPQDRPSALHHHLWLSANRVATFKEDHVPPGGKATFVLPMTRRHTEITEAFQLVVDGLKWLPETRFELHVSAERRSLLSRWSWHLRHAINQTPLGGPLRKLKAKLQRRG
jgi:radical SAM protein with 4Fe4S-binding SPASM domain